MKSFLISFRIIHTRMFLYLHKVLTLYSKQPIYNSDFVLLHIHCLGVIVLDIEVIRLLESPRAMSVYILKSVIGSDVFCTLISPTFTCSFIQIARLFSVNTLIHRTRHESTAWLNYEWVFFVSYSLAYITIYKNKYKIKINCILKNKLQHILACKNRM